MVSTHCMYYSLSLEEIAPYRLPIFCCFLLHSFTILYKKDDKKGNFYIKYIISHVIKNKLH